MPWKYFLADKYPPVKVIDFEMSSLFGSNSGKMHNPLSLGHFGAIKGGCQWAMAGNMLVWRGCRLQTDTEFGHYEVGEP